MNKDKKAEVVALLREELLQAPSVVLASATGMSANKVNSLRSKLRAEGVRFRVVKNTLAKLAIKGTDMEAMADQFKGPTAVVYHENDAVAPAKILVDFKKDEDKLELKAGYLSGQVLDSAGVEQLSKMPSLDEARATLLRLLNTPATQIAQVINAVPQQIMNVINARRDSLS